MTTEKRLREEKGIIFLGAGAAKQDGAPIQKDLIKDFTKFIEILQRKLSLENAQLIRKIF